MRDKIRIELSSESRLGWEPFYAVLDLHATAQQIRDAKQRARITGREDMTYQSISFLGFDPLPDLEHIRLDTTSVEELNYLAKRLDSLSDEQFTVYQALFDQRFGDVDSDELLSVKDLINMTYELDSVMVASNIHNDEQLGQFVIENGLHPDVAAIPDDSLYLLDKRRIGELQRKNEGGVLIDGFYVVTGDYEIPEVYDGKNIPAAAEDGVFRLKVGLADLNNPETAEARAVWIALPIPRADADAIVKDAFGVESIEDCPCCDFESGIPQITAVAVENMASFDALNAVADRYLTMGTDAQLRFKAILEAENIHDADGALAATDRLNEYELSYFDSDAASFFKTHVCHNLDVRFDDHWLDTLLTQNEGKRLVERLGASITDYGILSARGGHLFEPVPVEAPEAKELKTQAMTDEKLEVVEVLGQTALFTNGRVTQKELPDGLYKYDLREGESIAFATVEPSVAVNHAGTIITKEPIIFGEEGYIEFDDDSSPNFLGDHMSVEEFQNTDFSQDEDESLTMGGMQL